MSQTTLGWETHSRSGNSIGIELAEHGESTIVLRGSLENPWTAEVAYVWTMAASVLSGKELVVDVTGLTGIDENGLQLLARMRDAGVRLTISPSHTAGQKRRIRQHKRLRCDCTGHLCCAVFCAFSLFESQLRGGKLSSQSSKRTNANEHTRCRI